MNCKQKLLLSNYVFPSSEGIQFLCDDFFMELSNIISKQMCISNANIVSKHREENLMKVFYMIETFLKDKPLYVDRLKEIYKVEHLSKIMEKILNGFVFFLTLQHEEYKDIDIFKSKKSICYTEISPIDVLYQEN